ncbi:MAG TPA: type II secretion system F family protein [Candidatus Binataceae bacterium]|nr:type II secretion system F family protein [Candidatus Binataceae bacterium]
MDLLIASGIFAVVITLIIVLASSGHGRRQERTTAELLERATRSEDDPAQALVRRNPRLREEGGTEVLRMLYRLHLLKRLEESMWQAGVYMRVSELLLIMVLCLGAGFGAGQLIWGDNLFSLAAGGGLAAMPLLYIRFKRQRRLKAFALQLPFALDLMKSSLEAGHSLLRGIQVLVKEFTDPLSGEFRTVLEQTRLGMPLPKALDEMLKRVPEDDLRLLVVAVKIQSEVGSSLAQIIGRLSEIVRTRQRLAAQIRSMTAQSRISGMVVGLLPVAVLVAFSAIRPGYAKVLFTDPTGIKLLKAAVIMDAMAFFTIRRILRVRY